MYTDNSLRAELNAKGYRQTPQRQLIFQVFQNLPAGNHLSAEKVHLLLLKRGEGMSLSTVYRILKIMTQMGILREVELAQKQKHYELNTTPRSHHHHIVCVQCHQTIEFMNNSIIQQGLRQVNKVGLQLLDCQLTLHVICSEALEKGWPQSVPSHWVCSGVIKVNQDRDSQAL